MTSKIVKLIESLGEKTLSTIDGLGRLSQFVFQIFFWSFKKPFRFSLLIDQIEFVGNKSIFIVFLTASFTGAVMAYQTYLGFEGLSADSFIGPVVAISLAKELGPVFTGLIIAGRCGAAMAAQIGTMKVTEQVDALEVMGIDPRQYLVVPRVWATVFAMPLLAIIFLLIGNMGSWLIGTQVLRIDEATYLSRVPELFKLKHVWEGLIKASMFGFFISIIGTYQGFKASGGAEGVGRGTNMAVVWGMVIVLIFDFFATSVLTRIL